MSAAISDLQTVMNVGTDTGYTLRMPRAADLINACDLANDLAKLPNSYLKLDKTVSRQRRAAKSSAVHLLCLLRLPTNRELRHLKDLMFYEKWRWAQIDPEYLRLDQHREQFKQRFKQRFEQRFE
jgi:hypothetical protein